MLIDIFHDTACPWCWVGKKHLFDALKQWQGEPVEIRWHPFFLDETIPPQGCEFRTFMKEKKGLGTEELERMFNYTQKMGAVAGINLAFEKINFAPNPILSHRLIALTPEKSKSAIVEAIYKAYFEDGLDIGDIDTLVFVGKSIGLDYTTLQEQLNGDAGLYEVLAGETFGWLNDVTSVPFYIINNKIRVEGSQSVEGFLQLMNRAAPMAMSPALPQL